MLIDELHISVKPRSIQNTCTFYLSKKEPILFSSFSLVCGVRKSIEVSERRMTRVEVCFHDLAKGVIRRHLFVRQKVTAGDAVSEEFYQGRHGFFWHVGERALAEYNRRKRKVKGEGQEPLLEAL